MDTGFTRADTERLRSALAALGEPHRFRLALLMGERPRTVGELAEASGLAQPLVSHHLSILSRAGLADSQRRGRSSVYQLSDPQESELRTLLDWVRSGVDQARRSDLRTEERDLSMAPRDGAHGEEERDLSTIPRGGEIEDFLL